MKSRTWLTGVVLLATAAGLIGCAAPQPLVMHEAVGPVQAITQPPARSGKLVVYSAWDRFDTLDAEHPKHTPYTVRSDQGSAVARVRNQAGSFGHEPSAVSLAPGRYWVEGRATNVGSIRVPVVVRRGQTTVVYLDATTAPAGLGQNEMSWVRQPSGRVVGWKDQGDGR